MIFRKSSAMKLLNLFTLCLALAASESFSTSQPCSFPQQCACSLLNEGVILKCVAMEHCLHQTGMDSIAGSIHPSVCPVSKLTISCSKSAIERVVEIKPGLFSHPNWRALKSLVFGTSVRYMFNDEKVLKHLPELRSVEFNSAKISINLGKLSNIMCCPENLSELYFTNVVGSNNVKFSQHSFLGFQSLRRILISSSPQLLQRIDFLFNTSASNFQLDVYGNLPAENSKFSSIALANLASGSAMQLGLHKNSRQFELDAPAHITGFTLSTFSMTNCYLKNVGPSPFGAFRLKTLQITSSRVNSTLLTKLMRAVTHVKEPALFSKLAIQFSQDTPSFPYEDFNNLCKSMTRLKQISISKSPINFEDTKNVFECPQLTGLTISHSKINYLPPNALKGLSGLKNLRLLSINLLQFPKEALRHTPKIEYLQLKRNFIMEVQADSLRGILPNLRTLDLSYSSISEPLTDAFVDQKNLTDLRLASLQRLARLPCPFKATWFRGCSQLKRLDISNNRMFAWSSCQAHGFLAPLKSLQHLDFSNCGFGQQTDGVIKTLLVNLTSLDTLRLSGNVIYNIEHVLSAKMLNLTKLYLNDNPFSGFSPDLLITKTPNLKELRLASTPIVSLNPAAFNRIPGLRIQLGGNQFDCSCDLMPFTDWIRQQYPQYLIESRGDWLSNAMCYKMLNGSERSSNKVRLLDFNLSWWDCYSRRLIVGLSSSIGGLLIAFAMISLVSKYRWKLRYTLLAFCIRHGLVIRKSQSQWMYDACFIYDETDSSVSEWVEALVLKLETDLQLRLYEAERDAPAGSNILDEAASAIDKSRHAVLVLSRGFLENKLNLYSAQWSSESVLMRRQSLAVLVMRDRLSESELRHPGCKVLHRLYRMCKRNRIVDCSGCGVGGNSANRLGLLLYDGADRANDSWHGSSEAQFPDGTTEMQPLLAV